MQMMYLMATLATADMPELMEVIKVKIPAENIFRNTTSRRNIAYSVVEHEGDSAGKLSKSCGFRLICYCTKVTS